MSKVSQEIAEREISGWLDLKKINPKKRELKKEQIDLLVDAIMEGEIVVNEDGTITQYLKFSPVSEGTKGEQISPIKELRYKSRLSLNQIQAAMKGGVVGDGMSILISTVAALTDQFKASIGSLDSEDSAIAVTIAGFFLPT